MARRSKIALLVTALAATALAAGSVVADADARSASTSRGAESTVFAADSSQDRGTSLSADRSRNGESWQRGPGQRMAPPPDGFGERDSWSVAETAQWVAIAALAGFAVALLIWRPWRPKRGPQEAAWQATNSDIPMASAAASPAAETQPTVASPSIDSPDQDTEPKT